MTKLRNIAATLFSAGLVLTPAPTTADEVTHLAAPTDKNDVSLRVEGAHQIIGKLADTLGITRYETGLDEYGQPSFNMDLPDYDALIVDRKLVSTLVHLFCEAQDLNTSPESWDYNHLVSKAIFETIRDDLNMVMEDHPDKHPYDQSALNQVVWNLASIYGSELSRSAASNRCYEALALQE